MSRALILSLVVVGCGPVAVTSAPKPGQEQALAIVSEVMGVAPGVLWRESDVVTCPSGRPGWITERQQCQTGSANFDTGVVEVGWSDGTPFSRTALAHEACHLAANTLAHDGPCFCDEAGCSQYEHGKVGKVNRALADAGF